MSSDILLGIGIGVAVTLVICTWLDQRGHDEWMALADRYEALIEKLQSKQATDEADWWKQS